MDDRFLKGQRRNPDPAFAQNLRAQLRELENAEAPRRERHVAPLLAAAAALVAVAALVMSPGLRLRAQAALDLFRVREFAVVEVNEARAQQLREQKFDPSTLFVGDAHQAIGGGPAQAFANLASAEAAAGFTAQRPEVMPRSLSADTVFVHKGGSASGMVDTRSLRQLMDTFDVRDLQVPAGLEGQSIRFEVSPVLVQTYRSTGRSRAALMQCASPEVFLPKGVDLARLGEIGLRLVGLERDEAHRLAGSIDWRSTVVLPVLVSATSFQQVDVRGERGLYVETFNPGEHSGGKDGPGAAVLWTREGRVYALVGNLDRMSMLQMAESVR
jgi:hypothetical protein